MSEKQQNSSLEVLKNKIQQAERESKQKDEAETTGVASPTRISLELFSGVCVGTGMGFFVDKWLGTSPVFLIILFILGAVAGGLNIYRIATQPMDDKE